MADNETVEIKKCIKKKPLRTRKPSSSDENNEDSEPDISSTLEETKILQKLRNRQNGVSLIGLALGKKLPTELEENVSDPFKVKSGGLVNMNSLKSGKVKKVDDAYDTGIGTQFSAETNKRDEDEEMMKYIESELTQRKIKVKDNAIKKNDVGADDNEKYCSPEEAALQAVPEHLRVSSTHRSEEMLSNQMLSGIPEVDLGIDAKIRNIEATEEAKLKLLWERHNKNEGPSQFVPTNMAVNFVQHNRFNMDETDGNRQKRFGDKTNRNKQSAPNVSANSSKVPESRTHHKRKEEEKATDDYHYEKFKKQFRRY